jgi:small-conductance mechanosensitive channel
VDVGVSYDSDLEHVERVTLDVARSVLAEAEGGVLEQPPLVRFHSFGDSSIDFEVRMMVSQFTSQGVIRHEFIKRLHERFGREGIEIPFPIRTLVMRAPASEGPRAVDAAPPS